MRARVLIVEDEIIVALFLEDILAELGYEVAGVASRLDDAIARDPDYDAAVLDVHLNGRNVFDFADALAGRGVPFVFATGYGERFAFPEPFRDASMLLKPYTEAAVRAVLYGKPAK